MTTKFLTAAFASIISVAAFAQAQPVPAPATPAKPVAPVTAPTAPAVVAPAAKAAPAPAAATNVVPMNQKVNLNTATEKELDALPKIGAARSKAIIEARAKGKFKDWADFEARNVVPKDAEASIKDKVRF